MRLSTITRYPVKSCRGGSVDEATVEPWGLAGDRRWMLVDANGAQLTAREHPGLLLIEPELHDDGSLTLRRADAPDLHVDVPTGSTTGVSVFRTPLDATPADAAGDWFADVVGEPARLVFLDDPTRRAVNPRFGTDDDRVSFADGYPLLVASTSSLAALNDWIAEGPRADEGPLPMTRFRPNLVVDGAEPWAEDGWRRIRVGDAEFRTVKGCDRCVMTLVDPWTAQKGKEPVATLARHRRWDGATWFAMNAIPDSPGAVVRVGDEVEVLESVPDPDGPPR
ncbi:MOSC domain-containing protein [Jatrophihabitans fulvus]